MAKYLVQAPDKEMLVVSGLYGVHKFKHNSFMFSDEIAKMFPSYFYKVPESDQYKNVEELTKTLVQVVEKKKAGRPKKKD